METDVPVGKIPQVAEGSRRSHGNSNPDVEWIHGEPWVHVRGGSDQVQSPFSTPVDREGRCKPVRKKCLGRNTDHVLNLGQGCALQVEAHTILLPLRMTESFVCQLLLPAARRHSQLCPTDPHSLLVCPNCGSDQDPTVCWGQALAKRISRKNLNKHKKVACSYILNIHFQVFIYSSCKMKGEERNKQKEGEAGSIISPDIRV